jgi:fatty acid desaturase
MLEKPIESSELAIIQQAIRKSVPKGELEQWTTPQISRVYRDLFLGWSTILLALFAAAKIQTWWMYGLAFLLVGFSQYALFILGHDAVHGSLHPDRVINDFLSKWFIHGPMFMGLEDGRRSHLEHHRYLGTELDPDRYLHSLENKGTQFKFLLFCTGLATFGKTVLKVTPFGKLLNQKTERAVRANNLELGKKPQPSVVATLATYCKERLSVIVVQPLLIILFVLLGLPLWVYILLWVAPIYFCVFLPDEIRAFCDHAVLLAQDKLADPYRLVTFRPSWLEAIIFSPHNMNYHAEHHLWPMIPYYHLPKAHQFIKRNSQVTIRKSYMVFLFKVLKFLPFNSCCLGSSSLPVKE